MLRPYQQSALAAGLAAVRSGHNGILVLPTGSGKSHVITALAGELGGRMVILQPTKEILEQNLAKLRATGMEGIGVYSASCNSKAVGRITLATIGSVVRHKGLFAGCGCVIVDECHLVSSKVGQYQEFIRTLGVPTLGLTATPYRLRHYMHRLTGEPIAESVMLTRTRPRIFDRILHITQVGELLPDGYLSPCIYERDGEYHEDQVQTNSTGQGYDDAALLAYNEQLHVTDKIAEAVRRTDARHVLVFCQFRRESERVCELLRQMGIASATVDGETPRRDRESILGGFQAGRVRAVCNVRVAGIGFDFPALDCVVLGAPGKSVAAYYQRIGRGIRPAEGKEACRVIDLCDNVRRFGCVETFEIHDEKPGRGLWQLRSEAGPLTGVDITTKTRVGWGARPAAVTPEAVANAEIEVTFRRQTVKVRDLPAWYLGWAAAKFGKGRKAELFRGEIERRRALGVKDSPGRPLSAGLFTRDT